MLVKIKEQQPIVIPRGRKLSDPCRDLLTRCLKTNPEERMTFEEFFGHPFLDLEHAPSEESHQKAVETVAQAVKLDHEGDLEGALELYTKALEYFVPLTQGEHNPARKEALRKRTMDYMRRAGELKKALHPDATASFELSERSPHQVLYARTSVEADQFQELVQLSQMTPKLATGLEIARAAEEYEMEAQFVVALEKYQVRTMRGELSVEVHARNELATFFLPGGSWHSHPGAAVRAGRVEAPEAAARGGVKVDEAGGVREGDAGRAGEGVVGQCGDGRGARRENLQNAIIVK